MRAPTRAFSYTLVSALGLACQLGVLQALALAGMPVPLATAVAVAAAIVHNFVWHRRWTWRDRSGPWPAQLARFAGSNGAVSLGGNVLLTGALAGAGMPLPIANLAAVAACGVVNFALADRAVFAAGFCVAVLVPPVAVEGAVLTGPTIRSWDEYVQATESQIAREEPRTDARPPSAAEWRRLRAGELLISERRTTHADGRPIEIVDGTVHHWVGRVFIPAAVVPELIAGLQGPRWRAWTPAEVQAMRIRPEGHGLQVSMRVARDAIVDVTYDIDTRVTFTRHAAGHATSRSISTRIVEVDNPGAAAERARPPGDDLGFLWRLNSYWRYVPVAGGVLVDCESLALSRGVPALARGLVGPLITRVSRQSLSDTLGALRKGFTLTSAKADTR